MDHQSRRSWLCRVISAAIGCVLGYWIDRGLEEVLPDQLPPITGTLNNTTLDPLTAGPYTLIAEPGHFALTGQDVELRVGMAPGAGALGSV